MGSLNHRTLLQFIDLNDLAGLKTYLDARPLPVDDRDEVFAITFINNRNNSMYAYPTDRMELPY